MSRKAEELDEAQERLVLDIYDRACTVHEWYWGRLHRWRRAVCEAAELASEIFDPVDFAEGQLPPWIDSSGGGEVVPREQAEEYTRTVLDCVDVSRKLASRVEQAIRPFEAWAGAPATIADKPGPPPEQPEIIVAFVAKLLGFKLDSVQRVIDHNRKQDVREPGYLARQLRRAARGEDVTQTIVMKQAGINTADFEKALAETFEGVELEPGEELMYEPVGPAVPPVPRHLISTLAKRLDRSEEDVQLAIAIAIVLKRKGQ